MLILDEWLPYPPDSGKSIRTWNLLRRLAHRHELTLLCYGERAKEYEVLAGEGIRVESVRPLGNDSGLRFYSRLFLNLFSRYPYTVVKHYTRRYRHRLRQLLCEKAFDLVHCEWSPYARFLGAVEDLPTVIMAHNVEAQIWHRRTEHASHAGERAFLWLQAKKMESFERRAVRRATVTATVTKLDARQISLWGASRVALVENGVDVQSFVPAEEADQNRDLLFLGALDWFANQDAVEYLVREILPLVLQRCPQAKLRVVGRNPSEAMARRLVGVAGVELVGEVPDVRPYLTSAAVVLVPLRIGGGSRIKILESLATGKAVVSTSVGAEGLAVADGVHLLLADTPALFAERTAELLNSPRRRRGLGKAGRQLVEEHYDWERIALCLESTWRWACDGVENAEILPRVRPEEVRVRP